MNARTQLVQRRDSNVAHVVPLATNGARSSNTLCAQWAPGHSSWVVQPGDLPLCKRCARYWTDVAAPSTPATNEGARDDRSSD